MLDDVKCGWVRLGIGCQIGYQKAPLPAAVWEGGFGVRGDQAGLDRTETSGSPKSM